MADGLWTTAERDGWLVRLLTAGDDLTMPTDVEVVDPDGRTWVGTVATLAMIGSMMDSYRTTGECLAGTYAWVSDLLLVRDDSEATAFDSILLTRLDRRDRRVFPADRAQLRFVRY